MLKELVDNALDAAEEAGRSPEITISVTTDPGTIIIADNGPGLAAETIGDILDSIRVFGIGRNGDALSDGVQFQDDIELNSLTSRQR